MATLKLAGLTARNRLYVSNLFWITGKKEVKDYFNSFGNNVVKEAEVVYDRNTGLSKGYAFVKLTDATVMDKILKTPAHYIDGVRVSVDIPRADMSH